MHDDLDRRIREEEQANNGVVSQALLVQLATLNKPFVEHCRRLQWYALDFAQRWMCKYVLRDQHEKDAKAAQALAVETGQAFLHSGVFSHGQMLTAADLKAQNNIHIKITEHSFLSTFLVGGAFALGWSPCIGPILATILSLASVRESVAEGAALLTIYSAGLAVPFLLAGWSIEYFFEAFHKIKHHLRKLEFASGMVLVGVGILLVSDRLTWLNSRFSFMNEWISAAEKAMQ